MRSEIVKAGPTAPYGCTRPPGISSLAPIGIRSISSGVSGVTKMSRSASMSASAGHSGGTQRTSPDAP